MSNFIKSFIFNVLFYAYMVVGSLALVWIFVLPRKTATRIVRWYFCGVGILEKWVLGLRYTVEGMENIPADGRYILAMKHQSAYETLKLLPIFGDVAIALKRELTWIPLWGWYTLKTGMIPIDRGAKRTAMDSLLRGARKALDAGRPILIYPQGTRTPVGASVANYPYKAGAARMSETLGVPIVPVALNSGDFWAKKAFMKRGGTVRFKVLPAITPQSSTTETLKALQTTLEAHSDDLHQEADFRLPLVGKGFRIAALIATALIMAWAAWWSWAAHNLNRYIDTIALEGVEISSSHRPVVSGFPFRMHVRWADVTLAAPQGKVHFGLLHAQGWPVPNLNVYARALDGINLETHDGKKLSLDSAYLRFAPTGAGMNIHDMALLRHEAVLRGEGSLYVPFDTHSDYTGDMTLSLRAPEMAVAVLMETGLVKGTPALLLQGLVNSLKAAQEADEDVISLPLSVHNNTVYVGPIRSFKFARSPKPLSD